MQPEGVLKLITLITKNYPNVYGDYGRGDIEELVTTWAMALEDFEDDAVMAAFKTFLINDQKGFPPAVGQIVALIPTKGNIYDKVLTPGEAWTLVLNAMKNVTYQPRESFDMLPEMIQRILGGVDALRELAAADAKAKDIEKQRFFREYDDAIAKAKRDGKELPTMRNRIDVPDPDGIHRPPIIRSEDYYFPGSIEVGNPRTGTIKYVQYAGYPYGEGSWTEHGGLTDEQLEEWHAKVDKNRARKKKEADVKAAEAEANAGEEESDGNECEQPTA